MASWLKCFWSSWGLDPLPWTWQALQCFLQDKPKWLLWRGCPQGARYSGAWSGAVLSLMLTHEHLHSETFTSHAMQYLDQEDKFPTSGFAF